jgi:tetratricopeptide (TPR) repeat protein
VPKSDWKTPALIGMIYEERRNWARAIQFYDQATQRNDDSAVLWFRIAGCRRELGQSGQARLALEHARQLCPAGDSLILQIEHAKTGSIFRRLTRLFWK